ncbi:hypothetical protein D3C84_950260 [compost metagenome]
MFYRNLSLLIKFDIFRHLEHLVLVFQSLVADRLSDYILRIPGNSFLSAERLSFVKIQSLKPIKKIKSELRIVPF